MPAIEHVEVAQPIDGGGREPAHRQVDEPTAEAACQTPPARRWRLRGNEDDPPFLRVETGCRQQPLFQAVEAVEAGVCPHVGDRPRREDEHAATVD